MSTDLHETAGAWQERLTELVARRDVPGAVLGVSHGDEQVVITAGVLGLRNPAPVTADAAFQVGSISKLYTATVLMCLAGPEILGRSVAELVPETSWMGPEIRVEHLLTHSSGLGGDDFGDAGRGDDCLAVYTERLARRPRDVPGPPGERYSYCNSGYAVLGRLVEVLSGETFDDALRTHLLGPLGVQATTTLPEQTILRPAAPGHNRDGDGPLTADDEWNFTRACGPLGGVCATAGDLLMFARLHLHDGRTADGQPLLSPETARLMRAAHLVTPPLVRPDARGLGFGIYEWPGVTLYGHDGQTLGSESLLRIVPAHDLALVVLANAIPDGDEVCSEMQDAVLEEWGHHSPRLPAPIADPGVDPRRYEGRYRNLEGTTEVTATPGGRLRIASLGHAEGLQESTDVITLAPIGDDAFVDAAAPRPTRVRRFSDPDADGRCRTYFNGRIQQRVDGDDPSTLAT